jgi:hypothetical protein
MTRPTINDVIDTFSHHLVVVDPVPIAVTLGVFIANQLAGDPVWLLVVGPPGSGKTELLNSLSGLRDVHEISTFTEAALLSGASSRKQTSSGGLLREFRKDPLFGTFGVLVFKDFGSVISEHGETRAGLLAALREIYDGKWIRHLGIEGGRTLAWEGKAGLTAAVTETIDTQSAVMGAMGERFVQIRMPDLTTQQRDQQAGQALSNTGVEREMRARLRQSVASLMTSVDLDQPRPHTLLNLAALAELATRLRSTVETRGPFRQIELVPQAEQPGRLARIFGQLDHGLSIGGLDPAQRKQALVRVALDSIPKHRLQIVRLFARGDVTDGSTKKMAWSTKNVADETGLVDAGTAERHLIALAAHGVVVRRHGERDVWFASEWLTSRWRELSLTDEPQPDSKGVVGEMPTTQQDNNSTPLWPAARHV